MYRIEFYMAVLSAAVGGGCMTGDVDGARTADLPAPSVEQFREQALASGDVSIIRLTAAQQEALQTEVTGHLNDYGKGTQIGINQVSFNEGNTILTLPLPGETKARAVGELISPAAATDCHSNQQGWACLWSGTNFSGTRLEHFNCETLSLGSPFNSSTGSIYNNQTAGTQTLLLDGSSQILNANQAPSRINDTGVLNRSQARLWRVCG
jgi:hypothetical protein